MVSILNNDDHPSFAIRTNTRLNKASTSPSCCSQQSEQQLSPAMSHSQYAHPHTPAKYPMATPRRTGYLSAQIESVQPISPSSSDGSAQDYISSQSSSSAYRPYAQEPRRDPYHRPSYPAPRTPPETHSHTTPEAKPSPGKSQGGRKNKYPCPYATSHGCSVTFTTSGHAARHGKKHTGEKGVHCPICKKAFTRKDNMKQHIRTHRTHSDDLRSTSEAEGDSRRMDRGDSNHASTHSRTVSQSGESGFSPRGVGLRQS